MNKYFGLALVIIVTTIGWLAFSYYQFKPATAQQTPDQITVNNKTITVEIADTVVERERGLSNHAPLLPGTGMLFIFDTPDYYSFWMKEMNFPIDILYLDDNYQIVDSWLNTDPSSYPKTFTPKNKAKYVLETNPGEILIK